MGWSFRESVKILPGVRLNFSRRGVGASIGVRHLHLGFGGGRAPRLTGGIGPLHYYRSLGGGEHPRAVPARTRRSHFGLLALALLLIGVVAGWSSLSRLWKSSPLDPAAPRPFHPTTMLPTGIPGRRWTAPSERHAPKTEPSRRREPPRDDPPR